MSRWYTFLLFLFAVIPVYSQEVIKRSEGQVLAGITGRGFFYGVGYSYSVLPKLSFQLDGQYESFRKETIIKQELGTLNTTYINFSGSYKILKIEENVFLNVILGVSGAKDVIKYKVIERQSLKQNILGGLIGTEVLFILSDAIKVGLNLNQRYYPNSSIGTQRWFAGIGLKYSF